MADFGQYLEFEQPVVQVEQELIRVRALVESGDLSQAQEVEKLLKKLEKVRQEVYGNLTEYQRVQLSRHFERPFTSDYIHHIVEDFIELHGDRLFGDDAAIIGGIGKFEGKRVVIVGHQRGRTTQERIKRNFGMTLPEGNRKAQRLYKLAERFKLPVVCLIDTQGAYPGIEAEARGQAEAIAKNLYILAGLKTPIVSIVIGEGGSGGALALGICDRLLMLENSIYSVISPEACASILWGKTEGSNSGSYAEIAAGSLKLTAVSLHQYTGLIDELIKEPPGGAHRDREKAAELVGQAVARHLSELSKMTVDELLTKRYEKFRKFGAL
jgi:acetyl-CoA carboxylase carboxyl transferase subunit alpha